MEMKELYNEAVWFAAFAQKRFDEANEENKGIEDHDAREKHFLLFVAPAASEICAQTELITYLFGKSEEQVNEDIDQIIEEQKQSISKSTSI